MVVGIVDQQVVVDGIPLAGVHGAADTADRLRAIGIERIAIERGAVGDELIEFVRGVAAAQAEPTRPTTLTWPALSTPHIHVGRLNLQQRVDAGPGDMRAMQRAYHHAVAGAEAVWAAGDGRGQPRPRHGHAPRRWPRERRRPEPAGDAGARRPCTAHDNYTFTHMVNVSVLTMAQARSLGIDGALLRQFGLAGLMHDIGKHPDARPRS
ncbi:MAG: hypothetical protein MZU95_14680 [Desulfomicrobium escambiense]|nr:hypothetical protein [Desulfomicrobium escambiense]